MLAMSEFRLCHCQCSHVLPHGSLSSCLVSLHFMLCTSFLPTRPRETSACFCLSLFWQAPRRNGGNHVVTKVLEGSQATVRFCTRHQSLNGHLCGPTSRRRKKSKDFQRFPKDSAWIQRLCTRCTPGTVSLIPQRGCSKPCFY